MQFTSDWFSHHIPTWERILKPFAGQHLHFLEIGCYEGRASVWMLENVLTHPMSQLVTIDSFEGVDGKRDGSTDWKLYARFRENTLPWMAKVETIVGKSTSGLPYMLTEKIAYGPFDFIYIDGSHEAKDVLEDSVMSWPMLNVGGIMAWNGFGNNVAFDAFISVYSDRIEKIVDGPQIWIRRTA